MAHDRGGTGGKLVWFFFGAAVGGFAALLLTPKTGEENRGELARRAQELAVEAQGRAGEWLDKSREIFEEQTQRLMGAFEDGRGAMREEIRKIPPRA